MAFKPAFSLVSHVNNDNLAFLAGLCASRQIPDRPRSAPTTMIGPDGNIIKIPKPCKEKACVAREKMIGMMFEQSDQIQQRTIALGKELAAIKEERVEAERELQVFVFLPPGWGE